MPDKPAASIVNIESGVAGKGPLPALPPELIMSISEYLGTSDALALAATNHKLHGLLNSLVWTRQILTEPIAEQPLWWAACQTSSNSYAPSVAQRALSLGAQPNASARPEGPISVSGDYYDTPFIQAVRNRNTSLIQVLLSAGAEPTTGGFSTALSAAAQQHDDLILHLLLSSAPDDNTRQRWANSSTSGGTCLLLLAALRGVAATTSLLLASGAKPSGPENNTSGMTPLSAAISGGFPIITEMLLDAGADTSDASDDPVGCWGTAVYYASFASSPMKVLWGDTDGAHIDCLRVLLAKRQIANSMVSSLLSPTRRTSLYVFKILLETGVDTNAMTDEAGEEPLLHAWTKLGHRENAHREVVDLEEFVDLLLDHGADVNSLHRESGITPLMCAARSGRPQMLKLLLSKGADILATDNLGRKAIDHVPKGNNKKAKIFKNYKKWSM